MKLLQQYFIAFTRKPYVLLTLLAFALLLNVGSVIKGGLYADDYIHASYFLGSDILAKKGFLDGIGVADLSRLMKEQFSFFDPRIKNYQAMLDFGQLPWWTGEDALLHFYRPVAVITHYIDYQLWPDNTHLMHAVNLFWYLLGLSAIYLLYRGVGIEKSVAVLALLFVILDQSFSQVVAWVAARNILLVVSFGFFSVYAYHRSIDSKQWYLVSWITLGLSLLSAEGGVGICAYLGAYMFTLDTRAWPKRILHLLPFALLAIAWQLYYQSQGFGAYGVDLYLDPGHKPVEFLTTAIWRLPGNFFELISGVDFFSGQVRPDIRQGFALLGVMSFITLIWFLLPQIRSNARLRFFLVGSLFALVPGLAISLSPRVMVLPNVGMAIVFAYIFYYFSQQAWIGGRRVIAMTMIPYVIFMHIIIALGLSVYILQATIEQAGNPKVDKSESIIGVTDYVDKSIVIINALKPFWLAFAGHELAYQGLELPASIRVLGSGFHAVTVTRLSEREMNLQAHPAFQFDATPVIDLSGKPAGHSVYLTQYLMGLVRNSQQEWQAGEEYVFPELKIRVDKLYQGKPALLYVQLLQEDMNDYRWAYWDTKLHNYQSFQLPAVGESVKLKGIFNNYKERKYF